MARPLKFKTVKELQKKIDEYFLTCDENNKPYTISGLALALDTSRQTLINYEDRDEFFDTIKKAKLRCENYAEEALFTSKNTAGVIFNMVNNYEWKNKHDVDQNVKGEMTQNVNHDLNKLSVEELKRIESILSKAD